MEARRRWDWLTAAAAIWGLAIVGIAVEAFFSTRHHTMFDIYAGAAHDWWAGNDMYAFHREWYRYCPLFAIAMSPLAVLPEGLGNAMWKLLNASIFVGGIWMWLRHVLPVPATRTVTGIAILLTLPGAMHSLHIGQANLLVMGMIFFGLAAAVRGHWWPAAGLIVAATLIKGYPIALAGLMAFWFPRAFLGRAAVLTGVALALPFLFQSPESVSFQYESWFHHLTASGGELNRERQRAMDNLLEVSGCPITPNAFMMLGAAAGAACLVLCGLHARQTADVRDRLTRMSMLAALWVVLFGPATESCTHVVFAPFAAWLLADAFSRRAGWFTCGWLALGLCLSGPSATDLFGSGVRKFTNAHGVQQIGELVLLGYVLVRTAQPLAAAAPKVELVNEVMPLRKAA